MKLRRIFITILASIILCTENAGAQVKSGRFSVNIGANGALINQIEDFENEFYIHPDIDVLFHFQTAQNITLSTGLSFQISQYYQRENISYFSREDDDVYKGYNSWHFEYSLLGVPVLISTPLDEWFFETFKAGTTIGWIIDYDLDNGLTPVPPDTEINRLFLDFHLGAQKNIFHIKKLLIGITPSIGYRTFIGNNNDWQRGNWLFKLALNLNSTHYA